MKMGALEVKQATPKELNSSELLHVQRVAVSNPVGATCLYLAYASSANVAEMNDAQIEQHAIRLLHDAAGRRSATTLLYLCSPTTLRVGIRRHQSTTPSFASTLGTACSPSRHFNRPGPNASARSTWDNCRPGVIAR